MADSQNIPKIFISYSWKPIVNKEKTLNLAERLSNNGVHVIIDEWDLAEGQDKYQFMEQMVNNPEITRVLLICNKEYADKANSKKGGVGIESMIVSDEIYKKAEQKKFIPVIFEKDEDNQAYVPIFVKTRIFIDLSNDENFEEEYENLLRNIFDKPKSKRPPIGTPPAFVEHEEPVFLRTSHKVKTIKNALLNEKRNYQVFIDDYYLSFLKALEDFEINDEELGTIEYIDDKILEKIEGLKYLRNDFVNFLETIFAYSYDFNIEKFFNFYEKLIEFFLIRQSNRYNSSHFGSLKYDQFRFFYYELFLYSIAVMIGKERYKEIGYLLNNSFVVYDESKSETKSYSFMFFDLYPESLNKYRNERLQMRRISVSADLIKQRADLIRYKFETLSEVDAILYYVAIMKNRQVNEYSCMGWCPHTSVYRVYKIPFLDKLISKRRFEKVKVIFNVNRVDELKAKIEKTIQNKADRLRRFDYEIPMINHAFNIDKIGTIE
ncbi:toll/interleukin-1 receptor domain-containing protein [Geofilum sp. OHC36d9]|uniref:toll/interleukin-1 receptor domain-containing protein n=1 Tax=Geofilum sp. OHC36d9 TaxID=3458413 RepID=UPI0040332407